MAHHRRKKSRALMLNRHSYKHKERRLKEKGVEMTNFYGKAPSAWNILFHTRPGRRKSRSLERDLLKGADWDNIDTPTASRKPHKYYW